jgi:hypothetical protein
MGWMAKKKLIKKEEVDIIETLMLKEAFDNDVISVHVKIGNRIVMLSKDEFIKIYVPSSDRLGKLVKGKIKNERARN